MASTSVVWLNTTSSHTSMSWSWAALDEGGELAGGVVSGGEAAVDGGEGERHVAPVAALLGSYWWTGSSSTTVIPSRARRGSSPTRAANVPAPAPPRP